MCNCVNGRRDLCIEKFEYSILFARDKSFVCLYMHILTVFPTRYKVYIISCSCKFRYIHANANSFTCIPALTLDFCPKQFAIKYSDYVFIISWELTTLICALPNVRRKRTFCCFYTGRFILYRETKQTYCACYSLTYARMSFQKRMIETIY